MKKIAVFCVSYCSDHERDLYLSTIRNAAQKASNIVDVDVFVSNNTKEDNPGYFGAIKRLMQQVDVNNYDYSIISNVDLMLEEDPEKAMMLAQELNAVNTRRKEREAEILEEIGKLIENMEK